MSHAAGRRQASLGTPVPRMLTQVMPIFAGLVTGSASALTSYLSSGAPGMVVHVKNIFPYLNKD